MPTAAAAIAKAEEDAHVDEELERVREDTPKTIEEMNALLGGTDSDVSGIESTAAMMTVYNRWDGVPSRITTDQAGQRLRVRFEPLHVMAGQLVWTTKPPESAPAVGTLLCPLHQDSEERKYLDGLHFEHGHGAIYKAVEKDKANQLQLRQMELMQQQTAAMQAMAGRNGGGTDSPVQPEVPADTSATFSALPELKQNDETRCHQCNEAIEGKLADHSC